MPHHPQPFFRKSRGLWYVEINGKQYNLGRDQDEAFRRYHDLMRQPRDRPVPTDSVVAVVDAYLDWCQKHRAPDTYEWYRYRLQRFIDFIPRGLRVAQLKPHHVQRWVDSFEHLSLGSKRNYCRAIQRAMRWAEQQGYVDRSPIAHLQKPPQGKRNRVVSQEEFDGILAVVPMREARDLLTVAWETGARAQELLRVEARHVDLQGNRWVFSPEEEKMCRMPRVVYLTDQAMGMTRRPKHGRPRLQPPVACADVSVGSSSEGRWIMQGSRGSPPRCSSVAGNSVRRAFEPACVQPLTFLDDEAVLAAQVRLVLAAPVGKRPGT